MTVLLERRKVCWSEWCENSIINWMLREKEVAKLIPRF